MTDLKTDAVITQLIKKEVAFTLIPSLSEGRVTMISIQARN